MNPGPVQDAMYHAMDIMVAGQIVGLVAVQATPRGRLGRLRGLSYGMMGLLFGQMAVIAVLLWVT